MALLHSVSYFFFLYQSPSFFLHNFWCFSSNADEVLSIKHSPNAFVFGNLNVYHKDLLAIVVELINRVNALRIFPYQATLLKLSIFLLESLTTVIYFFWPQCLFLICKFLIMFFLSQFPLTFLQTWRVCSFSSHSFWLFFCWLKWPL